MPKKMKDLTGESFGRLSVKSYSHADYDKKGRVSHRVWDCVCSCGNGLKVRANNLMTRNTESCGCWDLERKTEHGMEGTTIYNTWLGLFQRCYNKNSSAYEYYGGSGVKVCDEWNPTKGGSFVNFYKDMGDVPDNCSINRIGGAKLYSKDTCEWVGKSMQAYDQKIRINNRSGVTGVSWDNITESWKVTLRKENKLVYVKRFKSFEEAVKNRKEQEVIHYGRLLMRNV